MIRTEAYECAVRRKARCQVQQPQHEEPVLRDPLRWWSEMGEGPCLVAAASIA